MTCYDQNWFRNLWAIRNNQIAAELFKKEFRVSPQTFQEIINIVTRPMMRQPGGHSYGPTYGMCRPLG